MNSIARKWGICAAVLVVAIATTAANQLASPDIKALSVSARDVGTLSVLITPASPVPPNTYCTFTATPSGGTSPYHYAWAVNNSAIGTDSQYLSFTTPGPGGFRIQVTVTDQTSAQASDSKIISVTSGATCP
jgi:hypothetical protein